jgi:hypothetical protein
MTRQIWIIGTVIVVAAIGTYYLWLSANPTRVPQGMRRIPWGRTPSALRLTGLAAYAIAAFIALN